MSVPISNIVDVNVEVTNPSFVESDFSLGLIIGNSTKLSAVDRVKVYDYETWQTSMTTDGFATTDPEYLAVNAYFSQSPTPAQVAVGVKLSSDSTDADAVTACRSFNEDWYGVAFCYDISESIQAIATAIEAFAIPSVFFYQSDDTNCLTSSTNIMQTLKTANISCACGIYSEQDYISCAVLGLFSGLNSTDANSAYTIAFKSLVGFDPENITATQFSALVANNGNAYTNFSNRYSFFYPGLMANGYHVDEVYFIDLAKTLIQLNTLAGIIQRRKIPQTESGLNDIVTFITTACERLQSIGFIATGIWNGRPVLNLNTGDAINNGFLIQAEPMSDQSQEDRASRVAPPIYVALKAAGAIESVVIRVFVNR